ncbi:proline-rich receptor-like protein kinase PERK3 [Zingiber officinale]|uniref:Protein kinase domain-containing protein n=1 Tax=Zingiber officinale TaxID=94328 RepID=A0A8J5GZM1_ZINOF|nr:proline-rich receptor-like protein kinase PERK3 [Zingiber officinale]KAG6513551.1 hypothetical protein ZIOFF_023883 [Zingiber officinale]
MAFASSPPVNLLILTAFQSVISQSTPHHHILAAAGKMPLCLFLAAHFLIASVSAVAAGICPYDFSSSIPMIPPACYANVSTPSATSCCWYVYMAMAYAAVRYGNLTGVAFLPPETASACSAVFAGDIVNGGLVKPSLLSSSNCDVRSSLLAASGGPCQFPTVRSILSTADFSRASRFCASAAAGNLSLDAYACSSCQSAVISATFKLLDVTKTKEFVPCGVATTLAIWSSCPPSPSRFISYAGCMLQVLENVAGLGTSNLVPSPPPPSPLSSPSSSNSRSIKIALGSASAGLLSLAAIIFLSFKIRRPRVGTSDTDDLKHPLPPPSPSASLLPTDGFYIFTKAELMAATNGFDEGLLLGQGGAGKVYLGKLPSGQPVAIKRINRERKVAEFYAEVAILAKLRHRNLATLVGYCLGEREHSLVYEYMAGGNLARALSSGELTWRRRLQVAVDVAEGLAYLHGHPEGAVIHRDVKPTNVLLTEAGLAKLSDFGVSRVVPPGDGHVSTELVGTVGYVDPESFPAGQVSEATDVYSFGVVLLELVTGMRAVVPTPTGGAESIVHAARASGRRSASTDEPPVVDDRLGEDWDRPTVIMVFDLACCCVRPRKAERPTMVEVAAVLAAELADLEARSGDLSTTTSPLQEESFLLSP